MKNQVKLKKFVALVLAIVMALGMAPMSVTANVSENGVAGYEGNYNGPPNEGEETGNTLVVSRGNITSGEAPEGYNRQEGILLPNDEEGNAFEALGGVVTSNGDDITADFKCSYFAAAVREVFSIGENDPILRSVVEVEEVLNVSGRGITDLAGIEHFAALERLEANHNQLTTIKQSDLSANSELKLLFVNNNELTELNVSANTELIGLWADHNSLSAIDVGNNINLKTLSVADNYLKTLDVSTNTELEQLWAWENELTLIELGNKENLIWLAVFVNKLTTLDVEDLTALEYLHAQHNELDTLKLGNHPNLKELLVYDNYLETLDINETPELQALRVDWNRFENFDAIEGLVGHPNIDFNKEGEANWDDETFGEYSGFIFNPQRPVTPDPLDITDDFECDNFEAAVRDYIGRQQPEPIYSTDVYLIRWLWVGGRNITSLAGIQHFTALETLHAWDNKISTLNLDTHPNLRDLDINGNQIGGALDVSGLTALERLSAGGNNISELNLDTHPNLRDLDISGNQIGGTLDVSDFERLESLGAGDNNLTGLTLGNNPALVRLDLEHNDLNELILGDLPALQVLLLSNNNLTTLNLTRTPLLQALSVEGNRFPSVDALVGLVGHPNHDTYFNEEGVWIKDDWGEEPYWIYTPASGFIFYPQRLDITDDFVCGIFEAAVRDIIGKPTLAERICATDVYEITWLDVSEEGITSLAGIQHFTALDSLSAWGNNLTELTLGNHHALVRLDLSYNDLTELTLGSLPALQVLLVYNNDLTKLDLSGTPLLQALRVDGNFLKDYEDLEGLTETKIEVGKEGWYYWENEVPGEEANDWIYIPATGFIFYEQRLLTPDPLPITGDFTCPNFLNAVRDVIDKPTEPICVTDVYSIPGLDVSDSDIMSLAGIEHFTALDFLNASGNNISTLVLGSHPNLRHLIISDNQIGGTLNVSGFNRLESVDAWGNNLEGLTLGTNPALVMLDLSHNDLETLEITNLPALEELQLSYNDLKTLTLGDLPKLRYLWVNDNKLESLIVSGLTSLQGLHANNNELISIALNTNTALTLLSVNDNNLTTLNVTYNPELRWLWADRNGFTSINLQNNAKLLTLSVGGNSLTTLDVSGKPDLDELWAWSNELTYIDLTDNTELTLLNVSGNELETLDVSNLPALIRLNASNNNLDILTLGDHLELLDLRVSNNNLATLDLTGAPLLQALMVEWNRFEHIVAISDAISGLEDTEIDINKEGLTYWIWGWGEYPDFNDHPASGFIFHPQRKLAGTVAIWDATSSPIGTTAPRYGQILTAHTGGVEINPADAYMGTLTFQWQRSNAAGAEWSYITAVQGGTSDTYTIQEDDIGMRIRVIVRSPNAALSIPSEQTEIVLRAVGPNAPDAPKLHDVANNPTHNQIIIAPIDGHAITDTDFGIRPPGADGITWQTTGDNRNVFTGLMPNTEYTFYVRIAQTATHEASVTSPASNPITTLAIQQATYIIDYEKETITFIGPIRFAFTNDHITIPTWANLIRDVDSRILDDRRATTATVPTTAHGTVPFGRSLTVNITPRLNSSTNARRQTLYIWDMLDASGDLTVLLNPRDVNELRRELFNNAPEPITLMRTGREWMDGFSVNYNSPYGVEFRINPDFDGRFDGRIVELAHNATNLRDGNPGTGGLSPFFGYAEVIDNKAIVGLPAIPTPRNVTLQARLRGCDDTGVFASAPFAIQVLTRANAEKWTSGTVANFVTYGGAQLGDNESIAGLSDEHTNWLRATGSSIARWSVPDDGHTYYWQIGTTPGTRIEDSAPLPSDLYNHIDRAAANPQFRIVRGAAHGLSGVTSGNFRFVQLPAVVNTAAVNRIHGTIPHNNAFEYLVVDWGGGIINRNNLQDHDVHAITSGQIVRGWTRVPGTAINILQENFAGSHVYVRRAATATAPHGTLGSVAVPVAQRALPRLIESTHVPARINDLLTELTLPNQDRFISDMFLFNPTNGRLTINPNIPNELIILGFARNSVIEISQNGNFWFAAGNTDIRPFLSGDGDGYHEISVRLRGNNNTAPSDVLGIRINIQSGDIKWIAPTP